jgi:arylsulfatase A-like enzyme
MATEGVVFEQAAASAPSTLPSHASILTGLHPFEHGVRSNAGYQLPEARTTLAEVLRSRGYRTGAEIAARVLDAKRGLAQGFDRYRDLDATGIERIRGRSDQPGEAEMGVDERPAEDITRSGIRFIDARAGEPFFLWLHYFDPHRYYVNRPEFAARVDDPYLAEIHYMDTQIGVLLDHLEARGLRDRTLVALVADHGEGLGEHGEDAHAFFLYESTIRVPMLLWGPRDLPRGRWIPSLVRTIDLMPTVLDWLGVPAPAGLSGRSLMPLVRGEADALDLVAYGESIELATNFGASPLRYVRRGPWKYVHHDAPELYDVVADPGERENRAAEHPERVAALRAELETLLAGASRPGDATASVTPEDRARLEALGYAVGSEAARDAIDLDSLAWRGPSPASLVDEVREMTETLERAGLGEAGGAERRALLERALALSKCAMEARLELAEVLAAAGEHAARRDVLRDGVERCGEVPELLNNYAWVLATSPVDALRDGARAEAAALRAIAASGRDVPEILDTLAAAQAERGNFEGAAATLARAQEAARALRSPPPVMQMLDDSLARARQGQPTRE